MPTDQNEGAKRCSNTTTSGPSQAEVEAVKGWLEALCSEVLEEPEPFHHRDADDDAMSLLVALLAARAVKEDK